MNTFNKHTQCRYCINPDYGLGLDNKSWFWSDNIFLVSHKAGCLETWRAALVFFPRTMSSRLLPRTTTVCTSFEGTRGGEAWGPLHPETHLQNPASLNPQKTAQHGQGAQKGREWSAPRWSSLPWSTLGMKEEWGKKMSVFQHLSWLIGYSFCIKELLVSQRVKRVYSTQR